MSFIRIKKIKEHDYAYLVKNKWKKKKGARQKVSKYLGKLIKLESSNDVLFDQDDIPAYIGKTPPASIIDDLVKFELIRHGFKQTKETLTYGEIIYYPKRKAILSNARPIVLYLNDGYFCTPSIRRLYNFNYKGTETEVATHLANVFLDAGIKIPEEMFIYLFKKIYTGSISKLK